MSDEVTAYLSELPEPTRSRIAELYAAVQRLVPDAVEGISYGMPALLYRGKGLFAAMSAKNHIGVYPFGSLGELEGAVAAAGLGSTKGSIHLGAGQSLPPELLERFVLRRRGQLDGRPTPARGSRHVREQ